MTKQGGVVVWVVGDQTVDGSETGTSFRQALKFMELGFKLWDTMIYQKGGGGAAGSNLCYLQSFEYMFILSKKHPSSINLIKDRKNIRTGIIFQCQGRRNRDGTKKGKRRQVRHELGRRFNVWKFYTGSETSKHPAIFPEALARDHILSWSNPGDVVFDPMIGSGTTAKMAKQLGRKWLGFDIAEEYVELARNRVANAQPPLFELG